MPIVVAPNQFPVRPKPQITSSSIISTSCLASTGMTASK